MGIESGQLRAARALLNIGLKDVSSATNIGSGTISDIENEKTPHPRAATLDKLKVFYQSRGVDFTAEGGIRPREVLVQQFRGSEGFRSFMDDVYSVASTEDGPIRLYNAKPANWQKWLGEDWNTMHTERMVALGDLDFRITAQHGDFLFIGKHAEYRWLPEGMWNEQSIYAYGDRFATLNFEPDAVTIVVVHNRQTANGFRALFDVAWEHATIQPDEAP